MSQITPVVKNVLYRSSRPGYGSHNVEPAAVDTWIESAKAAGIRTILCLLSHEQLNYYRQLGEAGLIGRYRCAGFKVIHRAVEDHQTPPVPDDLLKQTAIDFCTAELPFLVHCSAGIDRTGAVVNYLMNEQHLPEYQCRVKVMMQKNSCRRGSAHFLHVTNLAIRLFYALQSEHGLPARYRDVFWAAAMLHDIGTVSGGGDSHPLHSAQMIMEKKDELGLPNALMNVEEVATVAALHSIDDTVSDKKPLGDVDPFVLELCPKSCIPSEIKLLAGILRVADGLDYGLRQCVDDVMVEGSKIWVVTSSDASVEINRGQEKSGLLSNRLFRNFELKAASGRSSKSECR